MSCVSARQPGDRRQTRDGTTGRQLLKSNLAMVERRQASGTRVRALGRSWAVVAALAWSGALAAGGCDRKPSEPAEAAAAADADTGLTPELAAKVLAKVGSREITVGEFAAALDRMDPFEKIRYQSPEQRRKLLEELVNAELLAAEARRRGLDKTPETEARIRAVLRDELLARVRARVPGPEALPEREVRAYYDAHREELRSPERRRISVIASKDATKAREVLKQAREGGAGVWGALVKEHSVLPQARELGPEAPELAGDVGFVTAPGEPKGETGKAPDAVRRAAFAITALGEVYPEVVEADGKHYVVRMTSKSAAGLRSFAEAERAIRALMAEQRIRDAEQAFERELAARYPLTVDEAALKKLGPVETGARDAGGG